MSLSFTRTALILGVCGSFVPLSQAWPQAPDALLVVQDGTKAAAETGTTKAKVCDTRGDRTAGKAVSVWTITVSSSGGSCGHMRFPVGASNVTFRVSPEPSHGQITQKPIGPNTIVVYTPTPGYKGPDSFTLATPGAIALHLPYTVNVVP